MPPRHAAVLTLITLVATCVLALVLASTPQAAAPPALARPAAPPSAPGTTAPGRPLENDCLTPVCDPNGPIVAIGDSITYGYGEGVTMTPDVPAPPYSYPWDLQRILGVPVVNAGVYGDSAYSALHPEAALNRPRPPSLGIPALRAMHPRLVIVGFGTIEAYFGVPLAEADANLDAVLTALDPLPMVVVGTNVDCGVVLCVKPQDVPYTDAWDRSLELLARRHHATLLLDVEHGLDAVGAMTDTAHPNRLGYELLAERIAVAARQRLAGTWWPQRSPTAS